MITNYRTVVVPDVNGKAAYGLASKTEDGETTVHIEVKQLVFKPPTVKLDDLTEAVAALNGEGT